jgi:hypothetical protein
MMECLPRWDRVGSVKGEKTPIRRQILSHLLELQLPMVGSPAYTDEWGTPKSPKRYWKLNRFLESQLNNPSNNDRPNIGQAMIEWRETLNGFKRLTRTSKMKIDRATKRKRKCQRPIWKKL